MARTSAKGTLIDVNGLTVVDSFIARVIRLLGPEACAAGIQPAVAITLVELGIPMGPLDTALSAEQGMTCYGGCAAIPSPPTMTIQNAEAAAVLTIAAAAGLIRVRQALRAAAQEAGLGLVDQTKLITADGKLARNILVYASGYRGTLRVSQAAERGHRGGPGEFQRRRPGDRGRG